jgi:glyoxylase-like metal-dependent hydrolase (beta-lactamase superfamily II)
MLAIHTLECLLALAIAACIAPLSHSASQTGTCNGAPANSGTYSFTVGNGTFKSISDGYISLPASIFLDSPGLVQRAFQRIFPPRGGVVDFIPFGINPLYLEIGEDKILFDAGAGPYVGETANKLASQLELEGISRDDITKVFLTHGHFDHAGGLIDPQADELTFPNATVFLHEDELNFWQAVINNSTVLKAALPTELRGAVIAAADTIFSKLQVRLLKA